MKYFYLIPLFILSFQASTEEDRLNRESNDYKYTSLGVHFIEAEKSGFAINLSVDLPGSFYATLERKADGVDYKRESYDKVVDTIRLGAHMGVGDLIGSMSAGDVKLKIKNLFDVFAEVGIKTSDFDGERFNFEGNDSHASFVAGIRFGNSNSWEGKIFLDASKEAVIIDYKTGDISPTHKNQINTYTMAVESLGFKMIKKILIYLEDNAKLKIVYI